jgi:putative membrane protein
MQMIANLMVALVAAIQGGIAIVEMFFWRQPWVHGRIGFNQTEADKCTEIVRNAGLYNGFLAAGLLWGLCGYDPLGHFRMFLLACVIVAGVFGAITLSWKTLLLQAAPGIIAAYVLWSAQGAKPV